MSKIVLTDAATPTGISPSATALYTKSGGAPGTDGLYYKQGAGPEVGPLVVGTVNDLQDAYDGGGAIVTNAVGGSVSISSTAVGGPDALAVTVGGSTNATGVDVTNSGPGVSVSAKALGTGNAVEVEVVNSVGLLVGVFGGLATAKGIEVALTDYGAGAAGTGLSVSVDGTGPSALFEQIGNGNTLELYPTDGLAIYAEKGNTGNGIEVKMISPAAGSGLRVDSFTAGATSPGVDIAHVGQAVGVLATMTNAVNATGFSTVVSGTGGSSRGVSVAFSDASASGTGMRVEFSGATATGTGLDISNAAGVNSFLAQNISMASGSTGSGIELTHNGTGIGIGIAHTGVGTASTRGLKVLAPNAGSVFYGAEIDVTSTKSPLLLIQRGAGNLLEAQKAAVPVFTVDDDGNTTTPSVVFGGSRITVEGDSGVAGEPINPRVSLTSGAVDVGVLDRVYTFYSKVTGSIDLESVSSAQNTRPTVFQFSNTSGVSQSINLLNAARYPNGAEIIVLNTGTDAINLTDAVGRTLTDLAIAGVSPVNISGNAGRRLMALNFGVGGGSGSTYWVVTGTI